MLLFEVSDCDIDVNFIIESIREKVSDDCELKLVFKLLFNKISKQLECRAEVILSDIKSVEEANTL